jgi:hypothetical protein
MCTACACANSAALDSYACLPAGSSENLKQLQAYVVPLTLPLTAAVSLLLVLLLLLLRVPLLMPPS